MQSLQVNVAAVDRADLMSSTDAKASLLVSQLAASACRSSMCRSSLISRSSYRDSSYRVQVAHEPWIGPTRLCHASTVRPFRDSLEQLDVDHELKAT